MLKILFMCTGNSCRSQMAQAWANTLHAGRIQAFSAGSSPAKEVMPLTVRVMAEAGIDISGEKPKGLDAFSGQSFDYVITLCDSARRACLIWNGQGLRVHAGFEDPYELAAAAKSEEEALGHYRRIRDQIRDFVAKMPSNLTKLPPPLK